MMKKIEKPANKHKTAKKKLRFESCKKRKRNSNPSLQQMCSDLVRFNKFKTFNELV